ncbi:MAG: hypothetical protein ABWZ27_11660 [Aestuariivirgaceae bacterium]
MTGEQRQDFLRRKGVKTVEPTGPDPIATAQTSQGVLQRGFLGMVYDYTLGALENALAEDEARPATVKPAASPKPAASGRLDEFFKDIEGDFKCFRQGKPCQAGSETLKGKVVLIGWAHDDDAGIQKIRDLLAKYMDVKTDKVIAEISPSEFRSAGTRDRRCMGVAKERCIPGDMEGGTQRTLAATTKAAEAAAKLAHRLDPEAAAAIARRYAGEQSMYKVLNACQELITSKYKSLSRAQIKALNGLDQQYVDAINHANEETALEARSRDRHMRQIAMDNLPDQNSTLFVVLGGLHVDYLARGLEHNDSVLGLYPESSYRTIQRSVRQTA